MNKELQVYLDRMRSLQSRVLTEQKFAYHTHHIVPTFMGGSDAEENKVKLTIDEHVEAHIELANCFPIGSDERNKNLCSANVTKVWANKNYSELNISGENNPMWGKRHSKQTKNTIGKMSAKKIFNDEYRRKLSIASSGKNNPMWGKQHSKKTKKKISEAQKGEKHHWYGTNRPDSVKRKISESQPNRQRIAKCDMNGNILEVYASISIAAKNNLVAQSALSTYFIKSPITKYGRIRHVGGFTWKLIDEKDGEIL